MAYYYTKASVKNYYIIVIYSLAKAIMVDMVDLSLFAISKVVVLT